MIERFSGSACSILYRKFHSSIIESCYVLFCEVRSVWLHERRSSTSVDRADALAHTRRAAITTKLLNNLVSNRVLALNQ